MFEELLELLSPVGEEPVIGYFVNNDNTRPLAIVQTFAINQQVYGLEIVVVDSSQTVEKFTGGVILETFQLEIYLTQHEFPKSRIDRAIQLIKCWKRPKKIQIEQVAAPANQANLRRYLVTAEINCIC